MSYLFCTGFLDMCTSYPLNNWKKMMWVKWMFDKFGSPIFVTEFPFSMNSKSWNMTLTNYSFIRPWMIYIVVPGWNWQSQMVGDCYHLLLTILHNIFVHCLGLGEGFGVEVSILLRSGHALFLILIHSILSFLMFSLHHLLQNCLIINWCKCNFMINLIVTFLYVGEHFGIGKDLR